MARQQLIAAVSHDPLPKGFLWGGGGEVKPVCSDTTNKLSEGKADFCNRHAMWIVWSSS